MHTVTTKQRGTLMSVKAIILAGGKGTRMKSDMPKVLNTICGYSLINHVILNAKAAGIQDIAVVTGYRSDSVRANTLPGVEFFLQPQQLGTAHAVNCAREFFTDEDLVLVLCGDAPLVDSMTIKQLIDYSEKTDCELCVLTAELTEPANYGRILRSHSGELLRIIERRDATEEEVNIREINSGSILFKGSALNHALDVIMNRKTSNAQNEYYLTDSVEILKSQNAKTMAFKASNPNVVLGANDRYELYLCERAMRQMINKTHMLEGVRIIDSENTYIDRQVKIQNGTLIYPNCIIEGSSEIGEGNVIYSSRIENSKIGSGNIIDNSVIESCVIGNANNIGPFTHLRKDTVLSNHTKVGSFSETKNTKLGEGSKIPHLSYVGDAVVGNRVNFGCGCVTANYDGMSKHMTYVGDDAFIGCNVNLVAPINVGNNTFIAAGSTVSRDISDDTFIIERSKQREHEVKKFKK